MYVGMTGQIITPSSSTGRQYANKHDTQNVAKGGGKGETKNAHHYSHSVMIYRAPRLEETKKEPPLKNSARQYLEGGRGKGHRFEGVPRKG